MGVELQKIYGEPYVYGWFVVALVFIALTFDPVLTTIFGFMVVADFFLWLAFKNQFHFNSVRGNTPKALFFGVFAFGIVGVFSIVITGLFNNLKWWGINAVDFSGFLANNMISSTQVAPLADNPLMIFFIWGFFIAVIETRLAGRVMEALAIITNTRLDVKEYRSWIVFIIVAVGASWFHIAAKGIANNTSIAITFLFFLITCAMITYFKEMESAVYLHVINNTAAVRVVLRGIGV